MFKHVQTYPILPKLVIICSNLYVLMLVPSVKALPSQVSIVLGWSIIHVGQALRLVQQQLKSHKIPSLLVVGTIELDR